VVACNMHSNAVRVSVNRGSCLESEFLRISRSIELMS
jgi:hypothetical protein